MRSDNGGRRILTGLSGGIGSDRGVEEELSVTSPEWGFSTGEEREVDLAIGTSSSIV